jgi:hypothetical protein
MPTAIEAAGGWIVRAVTPGCSFFNNLKEIENGEEKSEKRRQEEEEKESIKKEKEVIKTSW